MQAQTAVIQLLALFSPSVDTLTLEEADRDESERWPTGQGRVQTAVTSLQGLCTPQVHDKWGEPRQWRMDAISNYLSPCRAALVHMLVCTTHKSLSC